MPLARRISGRQLIVLAGLVLTLGITGGCTEEGSSSTPEASPEATPTPTPRPTEPVPTEAAQRQDPAEFAAQLIELGVDGNWDEIRPMLVGPFNDFSVEQLKMGLAFPRWSDSLTDPDQWSVERHERFTVVRSKQSPRQALVLTPDDGSWRYDPGNRAMMRIERRSAGIERPVLPRETNGMSEDAPYQSSIETGARTSDVHQHFQRQLGPIIANEDSIEVTLSVALQGVEEVRIPLGNIRASDASGAKVAAELTRTTGIIEDDELIMPVPDNDRAMYDLSLNLDRPKEAESIALMFEGIELVQPRDYEQDELAFNLHYQDIAIETLPAFLAE